MRYDSLFSKLEAARSKYENTVRTILAAAVSKDAAIDDAVKRVIKPKKVKQKKHWTQLPKNRKRVEAIHRKMQKAKKAKKAKVAEATE